jgi:hypothetical protein
LNGRWNTFDFPFIFEVCQQSPHPPTNPSDDFGLLPLRPWQWF